MKIALQEAEIAYEAGEIPVGAVVVCRQQIIAKAHNLAEQLTDITAHAEIMAITTSSNHLDSKYLSDCTLYVTLEPCAMCAGALAWAQLGKLVYGASDEKRGFSRHSPPLLHPKTIVEKGILEEECAILMKAFFQTKRRNFL